MPGIDEQLVRSLRHERHPDAAGVDLRLDAGGRDDRVAARP
ncbi:hypothetical protein P3T27_005824 [Kitasatospora sp. MAA19]|nr:hypothetical protein [Kitasatospora sp. MAA19]MDH6709078.1 hypothetical protein [Kitasatospora sp. MAA19]